MPKRALIKKVEKTSKKAEEKTTSKTLEAKHPSKDQSVRVKPWRKVGRPIVARSRRLLARRPHRSFRMTQRRDHIRSLKMSGYWSFTNFVRKTLWKNWRLFGGLALTYIVASIVISGFGAQDAYTNLETTLKSSGGDLFSGNFGAVSQAGILLFTSVTSGLSPDPTQAQTVLGGLALFLGWLTTIWLLRNSLAGHSPRLRDGLYNSGSPVLATAIVGFIITLQLLPSAIAVIIYTAANTSGLLEGGVSAMLVWSSVVLLVLLSLYWITSSLIALVIVTLPGMYPLQAIKAAGDLVVGRRLRVLYRLLWLALVIVVVWAVIMIPLVLFDGWIKSVVPAISWLPLVPIAIICMGSITLIYATSYIYLLYRRIVDDDATPA